MLGATACSAGQSGQPGPPPASTGRVESQVLPAAISHATLVNQQGRIFTLASLRGKAVVLVPFLTLCDTICPLTTGNLFQTESALRAAHLGAKVQLVELSVDPGRDTPSRLVAYAGLTGANWDLVTESPSELAGMARFFGFTYQAVPPSHPPPIDWLTGQPLAYVVNHSDGYFLIDAAGMLRFSTTSAPDFSGTIDPTLHRFLNQQGLHNLAHPEEPGWTPSDLLHSLGWLLGRAIP